MEDKIKFFGQYLQQIVAKETKYPNFQKKNTTNVLLINQLSNYHLELKNPDEISKDDYDLDIIAKNKGVASIDSLRSLGYAQPFMNYSIEDLVKLGWVKLI